MKNKLLFWLVMLGNTALAQGQYVPLNTPTYEIIERLDILYDKWLPISHTAIKPYHRGYVGAVGEILRRSGMRFNQAQQFYLQYLTDDNSEWCDSIKSYNRFKLWYFFREQASFLHFQNKHFSVKANPVFGFRVAGDFSNTQDKKFTFQNSRGAEVRFDIKRIVSAYFFITENQEIPLNYVNETIKDTSRAFVPGEGYWKPYRTNGIDYFQARGHVNINVMKYFDVTFGHDKNFIGNGIRSMFLSDNSHASFFLKLNTRIWRINYQNIWTEYTGDYKRGGDRLLPKKYAAFHHLNFNVARGVDIGFFEGIIFGRQRTFEFQYLNPIIFYRSIEQSLGSPDNALLGFDIKANLFQHVQLYGQFLLDEFNFAELKKNQKWWGNKYAIQGGIKYIDIIPNLDAQVEFNMARPFMYTHNMRGSDSVLSNYTHYNQPIAHPLGANFIELITQVRYNLLGRFQVTARYIYSNYGEDYFIDSLGKNSNIGQDINLISSSRTRTYGNYQSQGMKVQQHMFHLLASYQPWHNIFIDLEFLLRDKNSQINSRDMRTIYLGLNARWNFAFKRMEF